MAKASNRSGKATQTIIGLIVLVVLAGAALGVYFKQFCYDGSIYAPAELTAPDAVMAASRFVYVLPDDIEPMTAAEQFGPDTLYEKINGGAELFLEAGFVKLDCQRFQVIDQPDAWLEVFAYDMGAPSNAFSVFGAQRPDGGEATDLTAHAYQVEGALFFCHGQYYMKVLPAMQDADLLAAADTMARSFVDLTVVIEEEGVDPVSLFPAEGLEPNSLDLRQKDVFGCEDLNDIYLASYDTEGVRATAYLSVRGSADEAAELAETYIAFLEGLGAVEGAPDGEPPTGMIVRDLYGYTYIIINRGRVFGGVHECANSAVAYGLGLRMLEHLSKEIE